MFVCANLAYPIRHHAHHKYFIRANVTMLNSFHAVEQANTHFWGSHVNMCVQTIQHFLKILFGSIRFGLVVLKGFKANLTSRYQRI